MPIATMSALNCVGAQTKHRWILNMNHHLIKSAALALCAMAISTTKVAIVGRSMAALLFCPLAFQHTLPCK
jgi:hypothetical protein